MASRALERQDSYYHRCHVFVDDTNLWLKGQKYHARKLNLKDVRQDYRFRVHRRKLLDLVVRERTVAKAFLYGSRPPPNDSVWKAALERNFDVQTFERAQEVPDERDKRVGIAMGEGIVKQARECNDDDRANTVFIIVTGDRDFTPAITCALSEGIQVELWVWESGMSNEYSQLAIDHKDLLSVREIGDVAEKVTYINFTSRRGPGDIDPDRAIVFKGLPNGWEKLDSLAIDLTRLLRRVFYITQLHHDEELQDVAVEFLKSSARTNTILKQLEQLPPLSYKACSYAQYAASQKTPTIPLTNRFQLPSDLDTSDNESTAEAITRCRWEIHCTKAGKNCQFLHTEQEQELFKKYPGILFQFWKTKRCTKETPHPAEQCPYWHSPSETWCLKCKSWGHPTEECPP